MAFMPAGTGLHLFESLPRKFEVTIQQYLGIETLDGL
jgi:hypothetical protein